MSGLAEFHDELRAVARDLLAPASPLVTGGEPAAPDWARLAEAGWVGLEVPEDRGGAGASFAEVAVVLEELGRVAAAGPFLGAVLAVGALRLVEPAPARDGLLADLASGRVLATVAVPTGDAGGAADCFRVEGPAGARRLVGRARFVPDGPAADRILVPAAGPDGAPVLVDVDAVPDATAGAAGVAVHEVPVVDVTRRLGDVVAEGVPVDDARCWRFAGDPDEILRRGALAVAIDGVGLAAGALDATVAYAGVRHQFGRPIGSFQAVKHACADVAVALTISRRLVAEAVDRLVSGDPDAGTAVAMAKAHAGEAAVAATGKAVQLHGGIGYTWDQGLHAFLKRAALGRSLFGSPAAHRARIARRYKDRNPVPYGCNGVLAVGR